MVLAPAPSQALAAAQVLVLPTQVQAVGAAQSLWEASPSASARASAVVLAGHLSVHVLLRQAQVLAPCAVPSEVAWSQRYDHGQLHGDGLCLSACHDCDCGDGLALSHDDGLCLCRREASHSYRTMTGKETSVTLSFRIGGGP